MTLSGLALRPLGHPVRSQSLYRLRYPGSSHPKKSKRKNNVDEDDFIIAIIPG
jgi:hypothetical protein